MLNGVSEAVGIKLDETAFVRLDTFLTLQATSFRACAC
jgi:hypothetical protein